jgi:hypothetical protein
MIRGKLGHTLILATPILPPPIGLAWWLHRMPLCMALRVSGALVTALLWTY